ncbi:MAG: hypothetical protein WD887_01470 [Candidatus Saccharimonadales bacterium]
MKQLKKLYAQFKPEHYLLSFRQLGRSFEGHLEINGKKAGRPSKRIALHQKGLKVEQARIIRKDAKGETEYEISRINHLPTFEEVRIHTHDLMLPGVYQISLDYKSDQKNALEPKRLQTDVSRRNLLPSVDEPEAWAESNVEIK